MNIRKKLVAILFSVTLLMTIFGATMPKTIATTPTSGAISLNFSYSHPEVTASGLLQTKLDPKTKIYQITGITGTRNGVSIDSLLAPDYQTNINGIEARVGEGNDNLLLPRYPQLSESGFSYTAGGQIYNVYSSAGGYYELFYSDLITRPLTSFSAAQ
ncbi:MAG: hypothetical protein DSM106950_16620 [Stigonema ocellatum SAG 48.90 = DSM 106950]|nr:hypothetical protein [Stigonema ocellatum SAG 48.90 = DSM 106950]